MNRYVVIATMRRGSLVLPELLDEANSWRAMERQAMDDAPKRPTLSWSRERDTQITDEEAAQLGRDVQSDLDAAEDACRVQRMMRVSMGRR